MSTNWRAGDYEPLTLGDYHAMETGEELIVTLAVPVRRDGSVTIWIDATPIDDPEIAAQIHQIVADLNSRELERGTR